MIPHDELRVFSYNWLKTLGCKNRQYEYYIRCENRKVGIFIDVVGFVDDKLICVECGDIGDIRKISSLKFLIDNKIIYKLYHIPYGASIPHEHLFNNND